MSKLSDTPNAINSLEQKIDKILKSFEEEKPFTRSHARLILLFTAVLAVCSVFSVFSSVGKYQIFADANDVYVLNTVTGELAECRDNGYGLKMSNCNSIEVKKDK